MRTQETIPKILHYCWFGPNEIGSTPRENIENWRSLNPDFQIKRWSEKNFNIEEHPYCKAAYDAGKFAFVSDYVRLYALEQEGGIYLDTDVEELKPFAPLLKYSSFFALDENSEINTGLIMGSRPGSKVLRDLLNVYETKKNFLSQGTFVMTTCVEITTDYFLARGFKNKDRFQHIGESVIFPRRYFCPQSFGGTRPKLTPDTYTIHHYDASWLADTEKERRVLLRHVRVGHMLSKIIGRRGLEHLRKLLHS